MSKGPLAEAARAEITVLDYLAKLQTAIALDFSMFEGDSLGCTGQLSQNYQSHA
jgi:hypothetical protein